MKKIRPFVIPLVFVLLFACNRGKPHHLPLEQLAGAYSGLMLLHEESVSRDSAMSAQEYQQRLQDTLKMYNLTREQLTSEVQVIVGLPDEFKQFSELVNKRLSQQRVKS